VDERPAVVADPADVVTIEYRRATTDDVAAIGGLVERSYVHYVPLIGLRPQPMDADYTSEVTTKPVWVAERGAELLGVIVLTPHPHHLGVDNVAVAPEAQGLGIGSHLLEIAERQAHEAGLSEIRLFTHVLMTDNIAFYGRRGYVETHRLVERAFSRAFFTKRLDPGTNAEEDPESQGPELEV
jgi:ribosomal protein S18 acetylase RimI-like enzyme